MLYKFLVKIDRYLACFSAKISTKIKSEPWILKQQLLSIFKFPQQFICCGTCVLASLGMQFVETRTTVCSAVEPSL
jgi:hypothetical protein